MAIGSVDLVLTKSFIVGDDVILVSYNLLNWVSKATNSTRFFFRDSTSAPRRFYRIIP